MNISFSTPRVNFKVSNGYGYAAYHIVESLKSLGHQVPFQSPKAPVQLNFSQPEHFKQEIVDQKKKGQKMPLNMLKGIRQKIKDQYK